MIMITAAEIIERRALLVAAASSLLLALGSRSRLRTQELQATIYHAHWELIQRAV
jgi:hypothetical protein